MTGSKKTTTKKNKLGSSDQIGNRSGKKTVIFDGCESELLGILYW